MLGYQFIARLCIREHLKNSNETVRKLARVIGVAESSFYAKLTGIRNFTVDELSLLAAHGIILPPLGSQVPAVEEDQPQPKGKVGSDIKMMISDESERFVQDEKSRKRTSNSSDDDSTAAAASGSTSTSSN